jgi:hypothetical protein
LEAHLLNAFKETCQREGTPLNRQLQLFIEDYVKKHVKGNPNTSLPDFDGSFKGAYPTLGADPDQWMAKVDPTEAREYLGIAENWVTAARRQVQKETPKPEETPEMVRKREERRQKMEKLDAEWRRKKGRLRVSG